MTNSIFEPLQLSAGSHKPGSGKGCAMNVISWENGDVTITDFPECSDPYLSSLVQMFNDNVAKIDGTLSPEDSILALELGHMTVGTTSHYLDQNALEYVYYEMVIAAFERYATTEEAIAEANKYVTTSIDNIHGIRRHYATHIIDRLFSSPLKYNKEDHYELVKSQIELFYHLTGTGPVEIPEEKTREAVAKMLVCAV